MNDYTKNGECIRCGSCCSTFLPLTDKEFKTLKQWVKDNNYKPKQIAIIKSKTYDMTCPFLDKSNRNCVVYDIRPQICEDFRCDKVSADLSKYRGKREIYNLREDIFGEESISLMDFNIIKSMKESDKNG